MFNIYEVGSWRIRLFQVTVYSESRIYSIRMHFSSIGVNIIEWIKLEKG